MNQETVMQKTKQLFKFLKEQKKVFDSVSELTKREEKVKGSNYFGYGSYIKKSVNSDHLLLLNIITNGNKGKCLGIAVTYSGLSVEDSFFIVSVSDTEKKIPDNYGKPYYKSKNLHKSLRLSYVEFSEKLKIFNKLIRNGLNKNEVATKFEEVFEIFSLNNESVKSEQQALLSKEHDKIISEIGYLEKECIQVSIENEKFKSSLVNDEGIPKLKEKEKQLLEELYKLRIELNKRNENVNIAMKAKTNTLNNVKSHLEREKANEKTLMNNALNMFGNVDFLK